MADIRNLTLTAAGYRPRVEQFDGREHLVVPVVALVEGVVRAMNSKGPEFVRAAQFGKQPIGWNGRPVFHGHPTRDGQPLSGNAPEIPATQRVGTVFNSSLSSSKLKMEAWLDTARCAQIAPALLARAKAGDPIEISVGAFIELDPPAARGLEQPALRRNLERDPSGSSCTAARRRAGRVFAGWAVASEPRHRDELWRCRRCRISARRSTLRASVTHTVTTRVASRSRCPARGNNVLTFDEMPVHQRRELVEEMAQLLIVAECERLMLACPNTDIAQELTDRMERYREVLIAALTRYGD